MVGHGSGRSVGLFASTMLVAASMIGVGVFTTSGYTLWALGTPERVVLAWSIGGLVAVCGAISYAALIKKFTESGGEYLFLARSLHPAMGFVAGTVSMLAGFTGPIAAAALGLEEYLAPLLFDLGSFPPSNLIALMAIIACATLNSMRLGWAASVQTIVTCAKLILILGLLGWAAYALMIADGAPQHLDTKRETPDFSWVELANQLVWISFSFAGFNAAIYLASEVRDAKRTVPRAMIAGTVIVGAIYVALNAIFVHAASFEEITAAENIGQVAATAARSLVGHHFELFVRVVIVIGLCTSIMAMIMTGPRVYAKMAADGCLPKWFAASQKPSLTAIWFQAIAAGTVVYFTELKTLLGYLGLTLSLCSVLAITMLFVLRLRQQIDHLPAWGIPPAIFVVATVTFAVLASWGQPLPAIAAMATFGLGGVMGGLQK